MVRYGTAHPQNRARTREREFGRFGPSGNAACQGEDKLPRRFSTWAAIALAGIDQAGQLPATMVDRSIEIELKRKTKNEDAERLDRNARAALGELASKVARWAIDHKPALLSADSVLPTALDDRAVDNWRPLIALADFAGDPFVRAALRSLFRLRTTPLPQGKYSVLCSRLDHPQG